MKIARVNSLNNVNSNQKSKRASNNPNFGLFVLADEEVGVRLVEKVLGYYDNLPFARKLVDLIDLCKSTKGIVYTDGKAQVEAYNGEGIQIYQTPNASKLGSLNAALESVVGNHQIKTTEPLETIGEIARRLVEILTDCPIVKNIQDFLSKPQKPITDAVSDAIKSAAA